MSPKRRGPTPSRKKRGDELRAKQDTRRPFRTLERQMAMVRVVRVVCDGCGAAMLNPHGSGKGDDGNPLYVIPCPFCRCETATFMDVVLVHAQHAFDFALEEAA